METAWILFTNGDPIETVRKFLYHLWPLIGIEAMLVQMEPVGEEISTPSLVVDPEKLLSADPFLPAVTTNTARLIKEAAKLAGDRRIGAVLRPCETRALRWMLESKLIDPQYWFFIEVDCLGSYPVEDYDWRLEKAGTAEQLTRYELRNARQGGISPDRYRSACQMCTTADIPEADIQISLIGMPIKEKILVRVRNEDLARQLHLAQITNGTASVDLVRQHTRMLELVNERRLRFQGRMVADLPVDLPHNVDGLLAHLERCAPCQACLLACPVYAGDWQPGFGDNVTNWKAVESWIESCAGCGMCEQACPDQLPLAAIHSRLLDQMEHIR